MSNEDLIREYLAKGGKVNRVPEKNFHRKEFEAETLKKRRILEALKERARSSE